MRCKSPSLRIRRICSTCLSTNDADVDIRGGKRGTLSETALLLAIASRNGHFVHALIREDVDVNAKSGPVDTPLKAAVLLRNHDAIWRLVRAGAHIHDHGGRYDDALQTAVYIGDINTIKLFCEHKADVNRPGGELGTGLQAAACMENFEAIDLLLRSGARACDSHVGVFGGALQAAAYYCSIQKSRCYAIMALISTVEGHKGQHLSLLLDKAE